MDKKGQSTGFAWIIALIFLFILGIGYVVFNQVMVVHIEPMSDSLINSSPYLNATEVNELESKNDKYMAFWHSMPFIIVILIVIYLITTGFRKGDENYG
ncbi:MAG: hypothetical protein ACOCZ5_02175 [bacterium]